MRRHRSPATAGFRSSCSTRRARRATTSPSSPLKEEAFPELEAAARQAHGAAIHWISLGQLGTCIRLLQDAGVTHAVMAGQVKHTKIFGGIVPDLTFLWRAGQAAVRATPTA